MKYKEFGNYLRELRTDRKLTQATIAEWLNVTHVTISRYESGARLPTFLQYSTLMQKFGLQSEDYYMFLLEKDELYGYQNLIKLRQSVRDGKLRETAVIAEEVTGKHPFTDGLYLQFLMFAKVMIAPDLPCADAIETLTHAVKITITEFSWDKIAEYRLSYNEITIIGEIANRYYAEGDYTKGIQILQGIKDSMDKHYIDEREKSITYPSLLFNLSCFLGREGRYDEVLDLCSASKRMALKYGRLRILPYLLYNMASALRAKGDTKDSTEYIAQAYHTARAMENFQLAETIKEDAETDFNLILQ